jgi:transforming growth factor-beta-induced protein
MRFAFILIAVLFTQSCLVPERLEPTGEIDEGPTQNIVELAIATPSLSTLVTVLQYIDSNGSQTNAADLTVLLSSNTDQYTVFAPTNTAFNGLDQNSDGVFDLTDVGLLEVALGSATALADALYLVVANHAVSSTVLSSSLFNGLNVITVAENATSNSTNFGLTVFITSGVDVLPSYTPTEASVTAADIRATNGVVHLIDTVLLDDATAAALGLAAD